MNLDIIMAQLAAAARANPNDVVMAPHYQSFDDPDCCVARLCWIGESDRPLHPKFGVPEKFIVRVKYRSYPAEVLAVDKAPDAELFDFTF